MLEWVLITLLAAALVICIRRLGRTAKDTDRLISDIDRFRTDGTMPEISLEEGRQALLHNSFVSLCSEVRVQRDNSTAQQKQTADMLADISHQLKTPLASLRLYCEMDAEDGVASANKEVEIIDRMEEMIHYILRFERLQADAFEMNMTLSDTDSMLEEQAALFSELYPDRRMECAPTAGKAVFDAKWLGEAAGNVIKNACEHTAPGGSIVISASNDGDTVIISVEDDGGGIPEEKLPLLFRRFSKLSSETRGCGLGLAITKEILERHHGTATAANGENGLRVELAFPAEQLK